MGKFEKHNEDRMRRAKSWLKNAEKNGLEDVESFLSYWIAFNAAYGRLPDKETGEWKVFVNFIKTIIGGDANGRIRNVLIKEMKAIKILINNKYIYEPFWQSVRSNSSNNWRDKFERQNKKVWKDWGSGNAVGMLTTILNRLYTLRNQVVHGGVTFEGGLGQAQLRSGKKIMELLVPLIVKIMEQSIEDNPDVEFWGAVAYPQVEADE
jgi:hypothetical protein